MECRRCDKCGIEDTCYDMSGWLTESDQCYNVCRGCYDIWYDDDYHDMWLDLLFSKRWELADKFVLDFLGKLGE